MIISDFFSGVTDDQRFGFLNEWNEKRDHRERRRFGGRYKWQNRRRNDSMVRPQEIPIKQVNIS